MGALFSVRSKSGSTARATDEQRDGRRPTDRHGALRPIQGRHGQGMDDELVLAAHAEDFATGDEHAELLPHGEQGRDDRGGGQDLFEVVEDQQLATVPDRVAHALEERPVPLLDDAESAGYGAHHQTGIAKRFERDEDHRGDEARIQIRGDGEGQSGLANPTRPGQRQEPDGWIGEQGPCRGELLLPTNQRGDRGGHRRSIM